MATEYLMGVVLDRTGLFDWPAGQVDAVTVPVTLPAGRTLADWDAFTMTLRTDPSYPRSGADLCGEVDPVGSSWTVAATAAGTADVGAGTVSFPLTVPLSPGRRRYIVDVVGTGGTAGRVQLLSSTWVNVLPVVT